MLIADLVKNVTKYSEYLNDGSFSNLSTDMNYFVYSKDSYMNMLSINDILLNITDRKTYNPIGKTLDMFSYKRIDNIVDIDCDSIQRKCRGSIHEFILKTVKRSPMYFEKHIIIIRNFDKILPKFQDVYKSVFEIGAKNTCFIISGTNYSSISQNVVNMFSFMRIPLLKKNSLKALLEKLCSDMDVGDGINIDSVIKACDYDLFTSLCDIDKLNDSSETKSSFVNVFETEINSMLDTLRKTKSLEKAIECVRFSVNKLMLYSLTDGWICNKILQKCLKISKLKKYNHELVEIVSRANVSLNTCNKKIFVYELMMIEIYEFMHVGNPP
jgi:hypothetical protein